MPSGAVAKRLMLLAAMVMAALLIAGFIVGAIGSKMFGGADSSPFLPEPHISLPPQAIFNFSAAATATDTAAEHPPEKTAADDHGTGEEEHHAPSLSITDIALTNTLLSAWIASIVIIIFFVVGARKRSMVPGRFQGVVETVIEAVLNFASGVLGAAMARRVFPVVATIFFFVLFNAWIALFLVPLYQAVGFGSGEWWNTKLEVHLVRPAGTDLNMPLALALISFVFVEYWGIRTLGLGYFRKFFAFGNLLRLRPSGLIDAFVGLLELISELVRVVSFTFRLFGNMTAGEILVVMITFLVPFVANVFVFGLELLVGLIQAVIFAGLTLVFLSLAVHHEEH